MVGLDTTLQWNIMDLQVFGDSQLIINQVNDDYNTKDDKITLYKQLVEEYKQHFTNVTFTATKRAKQGSRCNGNDRFSLGYAKQWKSL